MKDKTYKGNSPTKNKDCKHCGPTTYKQRPDGNWICTTCSSRRVIENRIRKKALMIEERGGKCVRCGFSNKKALEWHHSTPLNGDRKEYSQLWSKGITEVRAHLSECELICANCHRIEHSQIP